jgi:hypothetical protein
MELCTEWYHKIEKYLNQRKDVDPFTFSTFYRFSMNYFTAKQKQKLFYNSALQFLAYTPAEEI